MRLLPFFGFRRCHVDLDGWRVDHATGYTSETIEVEWLFVRVTLYMFGYRKGPL
jgi:hypothetical protein